MFATAVCSHFPFCEAGNSAVGLCTHIAGFASTSSCINSCDRLHLSQVDYVLLSVSTHADIMIATLQCHTDHDAISVKLLGMHVNGVHLSAVQHGATMYACFAVTHMSSRLPKCARSRGIPWQAVACSWLLVLRTQLDPAAIAIVLH